MTEETTHDAVAKRVITGEYSMMISIRFIMIVQIFVADDCAICRCWPEARLHFALTCQLKFLVASKKFQCIVLPLSSPSQQDNFLNFRDFHQINIYQRIDNASLANKKTEL